MFESAMKIKTVVLRVLVLAGVGLGMAAGAGATPVTFGFEAEVASIIDRGGGAMLPFGIVAGDPISTSFVLDTFTDGPQYSQAGLLSFEVAGHEFSLPNFLVSVENNHIPDAVPQRGRIADPMNTPIADQGPGISDRISLACDGLFTLTCGVLSEGGDIKFSPQIGLSGELTTIDSSELLTDLATWNAFSFREMSLLFRNEVTGGTTRIGAYVGPLSIVPEPSTKGLAIGCLISITLYVHRQRAIVVSL